jgi:hypothetical protein
MNIPNLVETVRIPELGPSLGKLVAGSGRTPGGLCIDAARERLTTRIIAAAGEARRHAASGEDAAAFEALGPAVWQAAWDETVSEVADRVVHEVNRHLSAEARAVGMSRRRVQRVSVADDERRALATRLGALGAQLVPALDAVERHATTATGDSGGARVSREPWQQALMVAGRRLEAAWLDLEDAVEQEVAHWRQVAGEIAQWRRSLWSVLVFGAAATGIAVWLGLVMGGYVESPEWFSSLWRRVFRP